MRVFMLVIQKSFSFILLILAYTLSKIKKSSKGVAFFLILLLLPLFSVLAQFKGSIKGNIIDKETKSVVSYSSIALYTMGDSSLVSGIISNEKGDFLLDNVPQGFYYIDISYLGYQKISRNMIKISVESPNYNIGTIELEKEVNELDEVVIKGEMFKAKEEVDKTVYAVNSDMAAAAHSGLEILRQVPAVAVDYQNNLTINGSANVLIFVDGKQRDSEFLSQLNPASIKTIEVMDNPSAKYNADVSAVLFVVTKKETQLGFTGRFETEAPISSQKLSDNLVNFEWGHSKFRVFASWNVHYERFEDVELFTERVSNKNNVNSVLTNNGTGLGIFANQKFHYGLDYFINDKNSVSFYGNYRPPKMHEEKTDYTTTSLTENGNITKYFIADNKNSNTRFSSYYSMFYKHLFNKTGHELTTDINYYSFGGTLKDKLNTQYYHPDMITPFGGQDLRNETTDNKRSRIRYKLEYSHPINDNLKLEIGYEGEIQWYNNVFYASNNQLNDQLKFDELRNSGYVSFAGKLDKFSYQGGLRLENADILINNETTADYYCILPQLNLNYKLNKENSLKLSYRKSIVRPGIDDLNPFVRYSDSLNFSRGNPELGPQYQQKLDLAYTRKFKSNYLTTSMYMMHFNNMFNSVVTINEKNVAESFVDNVGKGFEYGISMRGGFQVLKFWRLNPDLTLFHKELLEVGDEGKYDIPNQSINSFRGGLTSLMFFPKDFLLFFYGNYASPIINPQRTEFRSAVYIVSIQKGFLKQQLQVGLYAYMPFIDKFVAEKTKYEGRNFVQESSINVPFRNLYTIKLSYKFNYGNKVKKIERDKNTNEDNGGGMFTK